MKNHNVQAGVPMHLSGRSVMAAASCEREVQPPVAAPRQIWQEIDYLGQIVSEIQTAVDHLEKRLQPVLSSIPAPAMNLTDEKKEYAPCDLAVSLCEKIRTLRSLDVRLRALERDVQV